MDLTIPYTFYPLALPHWMAWTLFLAATVGGVFIWSGERPRRGWLSGLLGGLVGLVCLIAATMFASMIISFFVHDL